MKTGRYCAVLAAAALSLALSAPARAGDDPDALLTTPVTPQILAQGAEADAYAQGVQAYVWGYPLVRMERVARQYTDVPANNPPTSYRAPLNQIGWARELATAASKDMPTSNNDTFYMSAIVDLTEPFILAVPDTNDRYYVVDVFNMWQELEHYIGRRVTGTGPGNFALVPPGWKGELPAGVTRLDVGTDKIWLWGRLRLTQGETRCAGARAAEGVPTDAAEPVRQGRREAASRHPAAFARHRRRRTGLLHATRRGGQSQPDQTGGRGAVRPIRPLRPDKRRVRSLETRPRPAQGPVARACRTDRRSRSRRSRARPCSATAGPGRPGSTISASTTRCAPSSPAPISAARAKRRRCTRCATPTPPGKVLSGENSYTIRFASPPPVDAFWSLTVYNAGDKLLVDNPIGRYKVGTDTQGLVTAPDGSITITLRTPPRPATPRITGCRLRRARSIWCFASTSRKRTFSRALSASAGRQRRASRARDVCKITSKIEATVAPAIDA